MENNTFKTKILLSPVIKNYKFLMYGIAVINCDEQGSLRPFFEFDVKWVIIFGLTSDTGILYFQMLPMANGEYLF